MPDATCSNCNRQVDPDARFCGSCGAQLVGRPLWEDPPIVRATYESPPRPTSTMTPGDQWRVWLGWAGWALVGTSALTVLGTLLEFIAYLTHHAEARASVGAGFALAATVALVLAGIALARAFTGDPAQRQELLFRFALAVALFAACTVVNDALTADIDFSQHAPGSFGSAQILEAIGDTSAAAALIIAGIGFRQRIRESSHTMFAVAMAGIGAMALFACIADIVELSVGGLFGALLPKGALGTNLAGELIWAGAATVSAVALSRAAAASRRGDPNAFRERDQWLAGTIGGFALGALLLGIATLVAAGDDHYDPSLVTTGAWFDAVGTLLLAVPFALWCVAHAVSGWRRESV